MGFPSPRGEMTLGENNVTDYNYRLLFSAITVRAVEDLALVRSGMKIRIIPHGPTSLGKGVTPYPRNYFEDVLGYKIDTDPLNELIDFFNSDWFRELAIMLEPSLGFRLDGKKILKKANLAPIVVGMKNVRRQYVKRKN